MTLTRITGKVFGGDAPANELGIFGSAKAGQGTNPSTAPYIEEIQSLEAYSQGWGAGVVTDKNFPPMEEVTGVLKTISYQACYLLQEGIPTYDINTEYSNSSIVKLVDGNNVKLYVSLSNDNKGNSLTDTEHWQEIVWGNNANRDLNNLSSDGQQIFTNINNAISALNTSLTNLNNAVVKLTGNQTVAGNKTFTGTSTFTGQVNVPNSRTAGTALRLVGKDAGYIKMGDGTLIQWGNSSNSASSYTKSVSLYQSYSSDIYRVLLTNTGGNNANFSNLKIYNLSSSSFAVRCSAYSSYFNWLAIGQWY